MGLQRFPLGGFLGGMNLVDNPYSLKSGEAQLALDVDIGLRDVLGSRKGFSSTGLAGTFGSQTKSPTAAANFSFEAGLKPWANPTNVFSSNNAYASTGALVPAWRTEICEATGYGFSLPAGAVPIGLSARIERHLGPGDIAIHDYIVQFFKSGAPIGNNLAYTGASWLGVDDYKTYGGSEDLCGTTPSKADVELATFGIGISAEGTSSLPPGSPTEGFIDHMEITVYYVIEGAGTNVADHARPWYTGTKRRLMLSTNGRVKHLTSGEITELFKGTAGTTWCFEQMEYNPGAGYTDSIWAMNGTDKPKKWDGTTFADWGGKPPKGAMLRVWKNMMIVSGVPGFPQRVFYSDIANPESPEDETNGGYGDRWIDIRTSEDDLDPVIWLEVIDDVLLVFKKKSVNAIFDPTTFSFERIANVGCEGRFQSCVIDGRCYFLNRAGIFSVTAHGESRYESTNIEPVFKGTGPSGLEAIDLNLLATSGRMCALPNGRVYAAVTPVGGLANRWLLEAYPRLRALGDRHDPRTPWVKHSFAKRCIKCLCSYRSKDSEVDKVVSGLTNEAGTEPELVYLFESIRDGIEPLTWQWRSGFKALISEEPKERVRRVNLLMKGKLVAKTIADGLITFTETLESENESLQYMRPESHGRYHALDLSESGQTPTQVFKGELVLRGGKEER